MAYEKQNWECGEMITADKLNHMEDGIANACGDCDCGFECTETVTPLTEESVATTAQDGFNMGTLSYSQFIDADTLIVTFDGVEYECPRMAVDDQNAYGGVGQSGPDFSEYPFAVISSSFDGNTLFTETAGTYAIKIEATTESATTTACFEAAVKSIVEPLIPVVKTPLVVPATKTPSTGTIGDPSVIRLSLGLIKTAMKERGVIVEDSTGQLYTVVAADQSGILLEGRGAGDAVAHYYYNWQTDSMGFLYCPATAQ